MATIRLFRERALRHLVPSFPLIFPTLNFSASKNSTPNVDAEKGDVLKTLGVYRIIDYEKTYSITVKGSIDNCTLSIVDSIVFD